MQNTKKSLVAMLALLSMSVSRIAYAATDANDGNIQRLEEKVKAYELRLEVLEAELAVQKKQKTQNQGTASPDANLQVTDETKLTDHENRLNALETQNKQFQLPKPVVQSRSEHDLNITGWAFYRYTWVNEPHGLTPVFTSQGNPYKKTAGQARLYLFLDKKFDDNHYVHASIGNDSLSGQQVTNIAETPVQFYEAYYGGNVGNIGYNVGRMVVRLGYGLLYTAAWNDGARVTFHNDSNKLSGQLAVVSNAQWDWIMGDTRVALNPDTNLMCSFAQTKRATIHTNNRPTDVSGTDITYQSSPYNSKAVGLEYTGIPNIKITGEYGINTADQGKSLHNGSTPKGYYIQMKYKGAIPSVRGSSGFWVNYRNADHGFDESFYNNVSPAPYNFTYPSNGGYLNNSRGFEVGAEVTVAPNAMFEVRYASLKTKQDDTVHRVEAGDRQKYVVSTLNWFF